MKSTTQAAFFHLSQLLPHACRSSLVDIIIIMFYWLTDWLTDMVCTLHPSLLVVCINLFRFTITFNRITTILQRILVINKRYFGPRIWYIYRVIHIAWRNVNDYNRFPLISTIIQKKGIWLSLLIGLYFPPGTWITL